jgi:2-methylisocitrate lyase-like PEP mutase family enzyme
MGNYKSFLSLHYADKPLLIGNAWNVKSAQIIEGAGFGAIGTSSGAIASSLGYPDGEQMPFENILYVIGRIKSCTTIPLTVDLERGYTDDTFELTKRIQTLIDLGVAGINLEDAQGEEIYLRKLRAITDYLNATNQQLFINARTDGFLQKVDAPVETTIRRAAQYKAAGAHGIFVPGVPDVSTITTLAAAIELPLNMVATPKFASLQTLAECGVRRISMAVFAYKATYSAAEKLFRDVIAEQSFQPLF